MDITTALAFLLAHQHDLTDVNPHHQRAALLTVERHVLEYKRAELVDDVGEVTERTLQRFRSSSPHLLAKESLDPFHHRLTALLTKSEEVRHRTSGAYPHFAAAETSSETAPKEDAPAVPPVLTGP